MMFRTTICSAALVMGVLMSLSVAAPAACEGDGCLANGKPLDIMQFMREQAASTRVAKPRPSQPRATAKVQRAPHQAIAARKKPVPIPVEAAASFASRPEQEAQAPATSSPSNPFVGAAATAAPETTGEAIVSGPDVQLVDAEEFNDIDRKADSGPPLSVATASGDAHSAQGNTSWMRWVWLALGSTFAALATAVHQLIRV
jgi:hypothetical protein